MLPQNCKPSMTTGCAPPGLNDALMYNRRLWTVFIDAVKRDDNRLPHAIRENIVNLGVFVMGETFALMTKPAASI